jgi:hypothetical protein
MVLETTSVVDVRRSPVTAATRTRARGDVSLAIAAAAEWPRAAASTSRGSATALMR